MQGRIFEKLQKVCTTIFVDTHHALRWREMDGGFFWCNVTLSLPGEVNEVRDAIATQLKIPTHLVVCDQCLYEDTPESNQLLYRIDIYIHHQTLLTHSTPIQIALKEPTAIKKWLFSLCGNCTQDSPTETQPRLAIAAPRYYGSFHR